MKKRIIVKCNRKEEEQRMSKNKGNFVTRKSMVAVASLLLCLCLTGITVLGSTGKLECKRRTL